MKRIISLVLAFSILTAVFLISGPVTTVYAEEYRNGFSLAPVKHDSSGITTDTDFILKTSDNYNLEQIQQMVRLLGDIPLKITQNKNNEFLLTPERKLDENSLYTFVITTPENKTVTWTFQTQRKFSVLGTLPANQSGNVPVNTGIEIYFSHKNFKDIEKYFVISPKAEGRFETNGYAAVFIPKNLQPGTIYTVTIKKGLPLDGTGQKLEKDYVFAFETEPEHDNKQEYKGSLSFAYSLMEFSTKDAPLIPISIYLTDRTVTKAVVTTNIYKFNNSAEFIESVKSTYEIPYWSYVAYQGNLLPTENLTKVSTFDQTFDLTVWQDRYLALPEALPKGFYLIESTYNGLTAQVLVQSTDISAYYVESDTLTLFWVNSLITGDPVESAEITIVGEDRTYTTDASGVTAFDTVSTEPDESGIYRLNFYVVRKNNDELVLANSRYRVYADYMYTQQNYWRFFQTDRSLYKPDDLVQFWGFLKNRGNGASPSEVTVEIAEGSYWFMPEARFLSYFLPSIQKPLVSMKVPVDNGFFEGSFKLPALSPGSYQITVKSGDDIINSHYIRVENYVKPAYRMSVESDKKAIFLNDTVNFTVTSEFFDGTPVPYLDISYNLYGHPFEHTSGTVSTGPDGKAVIPFKAETSDNTAQGVSWTYLSATASLPESGMISGNSHVRVYINDINASFSTKAGKDGKITLEAKLNKIVLDKINQTADDNWSTEDILGDPVKYRKIDGAVIYHTYEKIEDGEEYDYINKVVRKRYRYEERKEKVESFTFATNKEGIATRVFELRHPNNGFYTVELTWNDYKGRTMTREVYLSNSYYIEPGIDTEYDWYHLEADKEKYRTGDEAVITFKNNDETVDADLMLFYEAQNGIMNYTVQDGPEYKTVFSGDKIPNFYVAAVYFNGKSYIKPSTAALRYNTDEKKIDIEMKADKEAYRPGDTVTINITARDENKNPVKARVNLAIIDEAMLEISGYHVDVLGSLYQWLNTGLGYSYSSHEMGSVIANAAGGAGARQGAVSIKFSEEVNTSVSFDQAAGAAAMDTVRVRSDFRDTALFKTITLNEDGTGTLEFKLPDNVTSWHVTLAAISPDLYGGTGESSLKVTLPFFINDSMNNTYLKGDFPYVGVSAYGNDLKKGEKITYQVTCEQIPGYIQTAEGKAFERTNIPLWSLTPGVYDIEIKAVSESGLSDGIRRTIYVAETYHEIEKAVTDTLTVNMKLTGGEKGLTTLIFADAGRGKLIPALYNLAYSGGSRLDQKYTALKANLLLNELVPDRNADETEVDLSQYRKEDGGYGILPYSESDVELTALLSGFLKDEADAAGLKRYFYSLVLAEPGRINAPALYGLAVLGEPVLLDLKEAAGVSNLSLKDKIYLALAFEEIGEAATAQNIYNSAVVPVMEIKKPYTRVKTSGDPDTILKETALAAVLASRLDTPHKDGLYEYIVSNYSRKILVNAEKLLVIIEEFNKLSPEDVTFTYEYDGNTYSEKITDGWPVTVTVPSQKLGDLRITDVSGNASVTSVFSAPPENRAEPDMNLKVKRTYYSLKTGEETTEFKQNEIVKVVIEWDITPVAIDSYYEITDYAPSGLKPIENPYRAGIYPDEYMWWFRTIDGQKVTFNVFRDAREKRPLVYYARVVSPGTFTADSTIIQGTLIKDSIRYGESTEIEITE